MSTNQKQAPPVVPQSQSRFAQGSYGYVPPRPPTPRTDGFHVATSPAYVQSQQQNQANNQVPPLRGMPPTGPPTQSSTPPNTDLKVQPIPQQPSMNIAYVSQAPVRGPAQTYYSRAPPPTTQTQRMPNHRQGQQPIYQTQPAQFVPMAMPPAMYINTSAAAMQYFNSGPRPQTGYVTPGYPVLSNQHLPTYPYPQAQSQPQATYYFNALMQRPQPQVVTAPQNPTQPPTSGIPFSQPTPQHGPPLNKNKRRSNAIPIIDPTTGKDKLSEMYDQEQDDSHPPSGESSARQTPQPPLPNPNKEVQAAFAKQVAQAISNDEVAVVEELEHPPIIEHMGHAMYPSQPQHPRFDSIVQSSKLQAATKEFIPAALSSSAKETTPVVSAITDAVEVTINTTNKPKDRESPAKNRKQREQIIPREREHKDPVKEQASKDASPVNEKPISSSNNNNSKEDSKEKDAVVLSVAPSKETVTFAQRDEKKVQKKDKIEVKPSPLPVAAVGGEDSSPVDAGLVSPPPAPFAATPETVTSTAKSKHASQKNKDSQRQAPPQQPPPQQPQQQRQQQQSPPPPPPSPQTPVQKPVQPLPSVPATQPSKPTNKTNKMRELNLKGASKEGTDMDAFNDNIVQENDTNTNHSISSSVSTDYLNNTNNTMLNNNSNIGSPIVNDSNKENDSNDILTIKPAPEIKLLPKNKIDVTDIVKDIPKPIKTIVPAPLESQDEPDRSSLANEKLVQAKNEANKANTEIIDTNVTEAKITLPYKEDQWSPLNRDGKKVYDKEFLLALRTDPKSKKKPENIYADIIASDDKGRIGEINRYGVGGGRATDFTPNFSSNNYPNKSASQRGHVSIKRKSLHGPSSGGGNKAGNKQGDIRISISVKEDVQLHLTENAWRPARFEMGVNMTEDDKKTAELYKKVRGVLNKLTPSKFDTLLRQVGELNIDNTGRLQGVIDLVFEKAIDEPNFSVAYALLCRELALMQVPADKKDKNDVQEFVNFRKLLIMKCQQEFEKNSLDETERSRKVLELEDCPDQEKKKDLQIDLDEYDRRLRMKSVGNIRFIGELFKQQMLTTNIMLRCLNNLLETRDEESLECLCKLLTTVGKELEIAKNVDLSSIFNTMKAIADKKGKISSRVRFMLQDVIDLRLSKWVPRRQDLNPKTIDQIQKEADTEHHNIQVMNSVPITPRRDDRSGGGGGSGSNANANAEKKRRNVSNDDNWSTAPSRNTRASFLIQSDKLKNKPPLFDEPLGSSVMFGSWVRGSNIKTQQPLTSTGNMYAVLENIGTDSEKRNLGLRSNKDAYPAKRPSVERYRQPYEDGRGSRSGSQQRSRDNSATSQRNVTPAAAVSNPPKAQPVPGAAPVVVPVELSPEKLKRRLNNLLEEYLSDCCSIDECDQEIKTFIPPAAFVQVVIDSYVGVLERSKTARIATGVLFSRLIKLGTLPLQDYCEGLESVLAEAEELIIDIPKVWDYVAELIAPAVCENVATLNTLHKSFELIISNNHASELLVPLFNFIIVEKGPNFLDSIWRTSGLTFADFMNKSEVDSFIEDNRFEYLLGDSNGPINPRHSPSLGHSKLSYDEIYEKLVAFFKSNTSFDDINMWITANVGDRVKEKQFIRILATASFEDSIVNSKLKTDILEAKYHLLQRFVDNNPTYELQCLYALQALINKLEHPQGLLLTICNKLFEENVFAQESFIAWEESKDPGEQEGKGVTLLQLTSFFTQLKEIDEETSSASEDA